MARVSAVHRATPRYSTRAGRDRRAAVWLPRATVVVCAADPLARRAGARVAADTSSVLSDGRARLVASPSCAAASCRRVPGLSRWEAL